jgi:hypothetical protein
VVVLNKRSGRQSIIMREATVCQKGLTSDAADADTSITPTPDPDIF